MDVSQCLVIGLFDRKDTGQPIPICVYLCSSVVEFKMSKLLS